MTKKIENLKELIEWSENQNNREITDAVDILTNSLYIYSQMIPGGREFAYQYYTVVKAVESLNRLFWRLGYPDTALGDDFLTTIFVDKSLTKAAKQIAVDYLEKRLNGL